MRAKVTTEVVLLCMVLGMVLGFPAFFLISPPKVAFIQAAACTIACATINGVFTFIRFSGR